MIVHGDNMKQCEYCAKEISYHEMYCSVDCESKSKAFYEKRERFSKPFSVINGIFVLAIGISIFGYSFLPEFGVWGVVSSLTILSVLYFFLPFPPDVMINKIKLKKSVRFCRILSAVLLTLAIIVTALHLVKII